jgi:hypothetical protein
MKGFKRFLLFAILVLGVGAGSLRAQDSQVSGQVLDASNAAVPGAKVALTRVESGEQRQITSSSEGFYSFPLLLPGHYELRVEKDGFQAYARTGIVVETASISTIAVNLSVGEISQSVTVDASAPLLTTETSALAAVVENSSITNLPLIDRRSAQLQRLNGFVVQTNSGASASFSTAGSRSNNANYLIDGGTAQNLLLGVPTLSFDPPIESVQEFSVAISNYAAELGRSGGAVVQMTTKSGTNSFHGSAYEYWRNNILQATPDFALSNPVLRYNLFGGSLGGPIRKEKTFFFFNYEGRRQNVGATESFTVPTAQELTGNFNGIIDPATSQQVVVKNPLTGVPFAGNQIPAGSISSVGSQLAAFFPHINGTAPSAQFVANSPSVTVVDQYVARVDHQFGPNDRLFGRLLADTDHTATQAIFPTAATDPLATLIHDYNYNASGSYFHNFSPNKINEVRIAYTRRQLLDFSAGANTTVDSQIGLHTFDQNFFPQITLTGLGGQGLTGLLAAPTPQSFGQPLQSLTQNPAVSNAYADNFSWVRGSHQFKFGGEFRTSYMNSTSNPSGGGSFTFNDFGTSSNVAAGDIANLLLGYVFTANVNEFETIHSIADSISGYAQDDWKINGKLTLNLGIRYDLDTPRWTSPNKQNAFNPTAINPVSGTPGVVVFSGLNGASKYANKWDKNNFGPRVGFAWAPRNSWSVRGGFGVLYSGEYASGTPQEGNLGYGTSGATTGTFNTTTGILTPAFQLDAFSPFWTTPTPAQLTPGFGAAAPGQRATTVVTFWDQNHVNGYIYQASFDVQKQFGGNLLLDIAYLGTFGHSLPVFGPGGNYSINQVPDADLPLVAANPAIAQSLRPFPQYQNVQILDPNIGASKYNGVNIGLQKRYANGLQLQANYTYSKYEDNADSSNELAGFPGDNSFTDQYNPRGRWGLSGSDLRHRLVINTLYELPFGRGKQFSTNSGMIDQFIGGWSLGTIAELHTGTPLSPIDAVNNTQSFSDGVRPNLNESLLSYPHTKAQWFSTAAFSQNPAFTFGNAPRTFGTGPGTIQVDASILKSFTLPERFSLQFRAEALNVLNHPNWGNPNTQFGSPTFGQIRSLQLGNQSRILQLGLHLGF